MTDETKGDEMLTKTGYYAILRDFGVPVGLLVVLLWFARDAAIATHRTVFEPMVKAHVEFLQATESTLKEISSSQDQQARTMSEISQGQRDLQRLIGSLHGIGSQPPVKAKDPG